MNEIKSNIWIWADSHMLYNATSFGNSFYKNLLDDIANKCEYNDSDLEAILNTIKEMNGHPEDCSEDLCTKSLTLDSDMARFLNIGDVVFSSAFLPKTDLAIDIIKFLDGNNYIFVLFRKEWRKFDELSLSFYTTDYGDSDESFRKAVSGDNL